MNFKTLVRSTLAAAIALPFAAAAAPLASNVDGSFDLSANANIFLSTTVAHTTVTGTLGRTDVAWFSFTGKAGATVMLDVDNAGGTLVDTTLSLFRSNGEVIGQADDSNPADTGSGSGLDAFIGSLVLDADDTYYVALAPYFIFPSTVGCTYTALTRPDAGAGGFATSGCTDRSFFMATNNGFFSGAYTLHISNSDPAGLLPAPGSLALIGLGLLAAGAARRQPR
jgi:uncharacterized cupredoxin-like copper-binding protein